MTVISNLTNLRPLRQYCEIFNYWGIVKFLFLDRYVVGPVPELPETPTHLSLLSDSVMRTPALNELSDEEKAGVCVFLCVYKLHFTPVQQTEDQKCLLGLWPEEMPKILPVYTTKENRFTVTFKAKLCKLNKVRLSFV